MRLLLVSIVPPQNDCGVRIVMHRHLVERTPFELHVATNTPEAWNPELNVTLLELPYPIQRLRKSRFGPRLLKWFADYENFILPLTPHSGLDHCVDEFQPDVILTLAETGICHLASKTAKRHGIPLAGLFLDWFPIMPPHFGHSLTKKILSKRYRRLYRECDLALCTSDGMKNVLGEHPNSHVIYPMPGKHKIPETIFPPKSEKFRLVYVGSVQKFYGRMLSALLECIEHYNDLELIVVGGNADWPPSILERAKAKGVYLGFRPPEHAAEVLAGADVLLVVMSFEAEHAHFMRTSFTTKFLDYATFHKPIILWAPEYCTPMCVVRRDGGAFAVNNPSPESVIAALRIISTDPATKARLASESKTLNETTFNPDRLQNIFETELQALAEL